MCWLFLIVRARFGQQLAAGKLGQDWKSLLGGVVGFILPVVSSLILWPLLVWLFNRSFGFGMLWLGSLLGLILGVAGFFAVGLSYRGQDPAWGRFGGGRVWRSLWQRGRLHGGGGAGPAAQDAERRQVERNAAAAAAVLIWRGRVGSCNLS
jgi:hypothetical protein